MTPPPFPQLALLDEAVARAKRSPAIGDLNRVLLVGVQHLLPTTGSLVRALLCLGIDPRNVILQGKCYSTCPAVVGGLEELGVEVFPGAPPLVPGGYRQGMALDLARVWDRVREHLAAGPFDLIVLLDDGGLLLTSVPPDLPRTQRFVGIEQTTSGLAELSAHQPLIPVIDVAGTAVKQILEPPCIARAIVDTACTALGADYPSLSCGVVGIGNIGSAVAQAIEHLGHELIVFDHRPIRPAFPAALHCPTVVELIRRSQLIFGCTGRDVLTTDDFCRRLNGDKVFASGSSGDVEFLSIIKHIHSLHPNETSRLFGHIDYRDPRSHAAVRVLNGGFPVNFNRTHEIEPPDDIQLTRCLLFAAVVQSVLAHARGCYLEQRVQLNPQAQRFIYLRWADMAPRLPRQKSPPWTFDWIQDRSGTGKYLPDEALEQIFATASP